MADTLLRCPFCGGEARVVEERLPQGTCWQVGCEDRLCYAYYGKGYLYPTRRAAIMAWNRREEEVVHSTQP